ncbi:MAG: RsmD family RNA methyltransferase [Candidatus Parcubacteria bacterium]|nr:RsmD family RNA methyltransferase [Candidatus Parcubacteria bacterium]
MKYFFILGKNPILSKAEIEAVLQISDCRFQIADFWDRVLIIETEKELDVGSLNNRLGGTVKIGKILDKIDSLENFEEKFFELVNFGDGKVFFGFSLYQLDPKVHLKKHQKELLPVAMEIKRILREEKNINSRYVVSKELELSSVIVKKNKLLQNGAEICFLIKENEILVGQTLAVQAFEEFGARDFTRPSRDQVSGMLPPKLARIMINLAQVKEDAQILDPFCGSGTLLQEALILGYQNIIGSDQSPKAIADTHNNLAWLKEKYQLNTNNVRVFNLPVEEMSQEIKPNSIEAIITEPFLGPPIKGNENISQIESIIKELDALYLQAFNEFQISLKKQGKIVIIFPVFNLRNINTKLTILNKIEQMGFKKLNKEELMYFRPNQLIWREIIIFEKISK